MRVSALLLAVLGVMIGASISPASAQGWGALSRPYVGSPEQDYLMGLKSFYSGDYRKALSYWTLHGEDSDERSEAGLALLYYVGAGTPVDYDRAFYWARLAAERGQPEGQTMLGRLYLSGRGVTKDVIQAYAWCETAQMAGGTGTCKQDAISAIPGPMLGTAFRTSNELQDRMKRQRIIASLPPKE